MRRLSPLPLLLPVLMTSLACSHGLKREQAEQLIKASYPVAVPLKVPESVTGLPGSPEIQRAEAFARNLAQTGWFDIERKEEKGQIHFRFHPKAGSPPSQHPSKNGCLVPAAQAVFVKALRKTDLRGSAKVTYQIRLANPTAQWPLYELVRPKVKLGDTKDRHAEFQNEGGTWVMVRTDETLQKED